MTPSPSRWTCALFVVAAALLSGCSARCCNPCFDNGACCVPGPGPGPCVACPCEPRIEVVDECCGRRGLLSRLFFWRRGGNCCGTCDPCCRGRFTNRCAQPCCPQPCCNTGCGTALNGCPPGRGPCGGCGPTCGTRCDCEPRGYLCCGYNAWRDARCVIRAANECAEDALDRLEKCQKVCCDFRAGFCTAYRDVALGGDGRVPAVPPRKFWQAACRTENGHARAAAWFRGYECGAKHALNDGLQPFRRLATPHDLGRGYDRLPMGYAPPVPRRTIVGDPRPGVERREPVADPMADPGVTEPMPVPETPDRVLPRDAGGRPVPPLPIHTQSGLGGPGLAAPALHRSSRETVEPDMWPF